jgi:predicted metal-binding membrane protein
MLAAMMVPLTEAPLRHLQQRSLAARRVRASLLFLAGYLAVWTVAGLALQALGLLLRALFLQTTFPVLIASVAAAFWQASPLKQRCLNRCHRRPSLAAFGYKAERDSISFGIVHALWCVGSCWALMLITFTVGGHHLIAMGAVALFIAGERLARTEPPRWHFRTPTRAVRILIAQTSGRVKLGGVSTAAPLGSLRRASQADLI